jgi:hypothetical protein
MIATVSLKIVLLFGMFLLFVCLGFFVELGLKNKAYSFSHSTSHFL